MKTAKETRKRLKAGGLRITSQRLLVLQILEESKEHLDAKSIYGRAREHDPDLSLATVYRALGKLREMGLVEMCYLARDRRRAYYEATDKGEHYHFTCLGCGRIIEIRTSCIEQACREVAEKLGLVFTRANVCLEGYCPTCATQVEYQGCSVLRTEQINRQDLQDEQDKSKKNNPGNPVNPVQK